MMPTRSRRGPPPGETLRAERGRIPDGRSVAIAAGDPSPALTGARDRSRTADTDDSPGSDGPSSWAYDDTALLHNHASPRPPFPTKLVGVLCYRHLPSPHGDASMPDAIPAGAAAQLPPAR